MSWRKSVDRIFELYGSLRGTAKYFGILSVIRNKIIGNANVALESYNTPLNWTAIKECLNTHYTDKRDIRTLEYQLTTLVQGKDTIENFYQKVFNNFSLILNNITSQGLDKTTETEFISAYRHKALDTFVRGLNGDLPRLLAIREPKDLPEALSLCTKLANQDFRVRYANNNQRTHPLPNPTRNLISQPHYRHDMPRQFFPQLTHFGGQNHQLQNQRYYQPNSNHFSQQNHFPNQQYYQTNSWQNQPIRFTHTNQYVPPRPTAPKPQPPPEPMDIDRSVRSQMVNYANRPRQQDSFRKIPNSSQPQYRQPPKEARNFHIQNDQTNNINTFDIHELENNTNEYNNSLHEDIKPANNSFVDVSDIHFLD